MGSRAGQPQGAAPTVSEGGVRSSSLDKGGSLSSPPDKGGQGGSGATRSQTKPPQSPLSGGSVRFDIETNVPHVGGNAAQRREHDKRRGAGTMSRSGAQCPCCPTIMSMDDIRYEGRAGRLGAVMTAVVDGPKGKEYRLPTEEELRAAEVSKEELDALYEQIPFGLPEEPLPPVGALGFRVQRYGFDQWAKLFTDRQLMTLGSFVLEHSAFRLTHSRHG